MSRPKPSPMCPKMTPSWLPIELFRFHQPGGIISNTPQLRTVPRSPSLYFRFHQSWPHPRSPHLNLLQISTSSSHMNCTQSSSLCVHSDGWIPQSLLGIGINDAHSHTNLTPSLLPKCQIVAPMHLPSLPPQSQHQSLLSFFNMLSSFSSP